MPGSLSTQPVFLFLQGPHGPFFDSLARRLRQTGATVWRVGFNAGDRAFWWHGPGYIPFRAPAEHWPAALSELISERRVTDLVVRWGGDEFCLLVPATQAQGAIAAAESLVDAVREATSAVTSPRRSSRQRRRLVLHAFPRTERIPIP